MAATLIQLAEFMGEDEKEANAAPEPLVLDPRDPMPSARALVGRQFLTASARTLHHHRGGFYEWNGACYRSADHDSIRATVWNFLEAAQRRTPKGTTVPYQANRARVVDVLDALAAACNLPAHIAPPAWLQENGMPRPDELLPVVNGLLHLPTGLLYPPSPDLFCLNAAGAAFDAKAPEPVHWTSFLAQLWPEDPQSIDTLQEVFGYLLTPDTSQQKIILVVGPKRSGKGTIARVVTALLGQDSVAAPTLASLSSNFGLAPLIGKSAAIIADARLSARADQASVAERLLSISGEDSLTIDRKFLTAWTGRLSTRFVIFTNELPRLADASGALASRFIVLTMQESFFGREDHGLAARLLSELPGILNWAREGYLRLRERAHFVQPENARDAIEELEDLSSPIKAFIKEKCIVGRGHEVSVELLFQTWRAWCERHGRKEPGTAQSFGRDLRAAVPGLRTTQLREEGDRVRKFQGIGLC